MRYNTRRTRKSTSKTRFDVALAQRAQRQSSRLPHIRPWIVVLAVLIASVAVGVRWFIGADWRIGDIQVQNNTGVPVEAIIGASGLQGEHFQFADLDKASKSVDELPGVEAVQITCRWEWRALCLITIQPARAMAVWQSQRGDVWNDYEGKVQRALDLVRAKLIIQIEEGAPPLTNERLDPRFLRALNELLVLQPSVTRYSYSPQFGLIWVNEQKWRVRLGDAPYAGAMSDKLKLARALRQQLVKQDVKVRELDVRFVEAPYYIQ